MASTTSSSWSRSSPATRTRHPRTGISRARCATPSTCSTARRWRARPSATRWCDTTCTARAPSSSRSTQPSPTGRSSAGSNVFREERRMSATTTEGLLIGGERTAGADGRTFDVINPATGTHLATVAEAGVEDVGRAVAAAGRAYETWGALSPVSGGRVMHGFANVVEEHAEELAMIECHNVGMPISDARGQLSMIVDVIRYYAGAVDKFLGHTIPVERAGVAMTFREPIGVVGLITPWNFPLNIANWKAAPALAAGNTVVLKPASLTPLSVLRYAELAVEAGLPPGALNVIPGPGASVGDALVGHPDVGKIGFTGSTDVGAGIARKAAATIKRVTLELGGKSACVVFADADLEKAGAMAPFAVFENCGQDCCARSRLLVEESAKDELLERYAATTAAIRVRMPDEPPTQVRPI